MFIILKPILSLVWLVFDLGRNKRLKAGLSIQSAGKFFPHFFLKIAEHP